MTVLGRVAGISVTGFISAYDHWIASILLLVVGGKMTGAGISGEEEEAPRDVLRTLPLIALSLAASTDALAVGVSFGALRNAVLIPSFIIGIVCSAISFAGGLILIVIGVRILAEHLVL